MLTAFSLTPTLLASVGAVLAGAGALLSGIAAYRLAKMRQGESDTRPR